MKRLMLLCIVFAGLGCSAQSIQDFFSDKAGNVSWLGIDYSHVLLRGEFTHFKDAAPMNPEEIKYKYFPAWNSLILNESNKYDFRGMFMLSNLVPDIVMITNVNAASDAGKMTQEPKTPLNCEGVAKIVRDYDLTDKEGLAIVFIADVLDKNSETAGYFITILDMKTKEVILCEHVTEKAGGIGVRNYWAGSLYNLVKDVKRNLYWVWKGKYVK